MDLLPCGFGLWNTEGQDILGSTHPVVILLSAPQARVVNIIPPILLYKKKPFLAFTVTMSHEKLAQGSSFFLFSASTEIWAAATERVTEDAALCFHVWIWSHCRQMSTNVSMRLWP